jgi:hypothetical protein
VSARPPAADRLARPDEHIAHSIEWERLRYDWSQPGLVKGTVVDSNIFKPGSSREIRATPAEGGGSRVELIAVRHLKGLRGKLLAPVFPLGLARRTASDHLRHFLSKVEEAGPEGIL